MPNDSYKFDDIIRLSSELNTVQDLELLYEKILIEALKILNADGASIQTKEGDELVFRHTKTLSYEKKLQPGQKSPYLTFRTPINKSSISGYVTLTGEILNIPDVYEIPPTAPYRFDPTYDKKAGYRTKAMLTFPLKYRNEILGVMQIVNSLNPDKDGRCFDEEKGCFGGSFDSSDEKIALHFANMVSIILQRSQMTNALIMRMIAMAELRDPKETGAHVNRVASYAVEIYEKWAHRKKISPEEIEQKKDVLSIAAKLHDVGKVAISDLILKKPSSFKPEEYEEMKTHTFKGARLFKLKQSEYDEMSALVALTHHENWDGTGYPGYVDVETGRPLKKDSEGKVVAPKNEDIPIFGRIVALADVYDALSSKRVYKDAWDEKSVLTEIRKLSGKKFDPELVDIFFESLDFIRTIPGRYPDVE